LATGPAPLFDLYPAGFPAALAVGSVVSLRLFVPGETVPQQRPRGRVQKGKGGAPYVQFYEDKRCVDYQDHVATHVRAQVVKVPVDGDGGTFTVPFENVRALVALRFNIRKPVSYPARIVDHTKKPDLDNLAKGVLDGLVKGLLLSDDNCITDLGLSKRYATDVHPEGVEIDVTVMPTEVA
jgi:Holliday junction resolvase RusA-like endonuclease